MLTWLGPGRPPPRGVVGNERVGVIVERGCCSLAGEQLVVVAHLLSVGFIMVARGEERHGGFGEVAALRDLPFVVGLEHDGGDESETAASLGKIPTTLVRRLISPLSRSSGFVDQILRQCASGKPVNAQEVGLGVGEHRGDVGELRPQGGDDLVQLCGTAAASGWAKIVRTAAATMSPEPLGTLANTLRMKCTRQRCQAAPSITLSIAALRPSCASEIIRRTPARPRARSERRKAVQKVPFSESPTATPSTSRVAAGGDPGGHDDRFGHDLSAVVRLHVGRVEEHVGELDVIEASLAERVDGVVELDADP